MPQRSVAHPDGRHVRTFHGRTGRVGTQSRRALAQLFPRYGVDLDDRPIGDLFGRDLPLVVELGSGMGDATAAMAAADPDTGILAVEVHTAGVAALLRRIDSDGLTNVRVMHADGVEVLRRMIPADHLAGVRIYFPDPWPKARHHKRRFVRPDLISLTTRRLAPGGILHAATDWDDYAEQMLQVLSDEPQLVNLHPGFAPRPDWRPVTGFERKGLGQGHVIRDLMFSRQG